MLSKYQSQVFIFSERNVFSLENGRDSLIEKSLSTC